MLGALECDITGEEVQRWTMLNTRYLDARAGIRVSTV